MDRENIEHEQCHQRHGRSTAVSQSLNRGGDRQANNAL
jgi:hypothetical protein